MEQNYHNKEEENFREIIDQLKNAPKINAPDNFEFNLLTRIKNKNFSLKYDRPVKSMLPWVFAPSAALAVSAVVIFFLFIDQSPQMENIFLQEPQAIVNNITNKADTMVISATAGKSSVSSENGKSVADRKYFIVRNENDAVMKEKIALPANSEGADLEIDRYIKGSKLHKHSASNTQLVSSGYEEFDFDGFLAVSDENELEHLKAKIDSLINLQKKAAAKEK